jgi:NAD(P)-dependent dehydrogenase (short-subunit alcohol dehydrogenase family)
MELKDKVVIVTGASRGIGRQLALEFARRGAKVALAARTVQTGGTLPGTVGETAAMIAAAGGEALAVQADVTRRGDLETLGAMTLQRFGRLDVLVNNAANTTLNASSVETYPLDFWLSEFDSNVHAPFILMGLAAAWMKDHGGGIIVNMSSHAADPEPVDRDPLAHAGLGPIAGYAVTKAALNRLTNVFAAQLAAQNITAVCVDPGFTRTEQVDWRGSVGQLDPNLAHSMELPVRTVMRIVTADDPLSFAGQVVRAY